MPDITYLGHACFRLRGRDGIVLCDPFDRSIGLDIGRPGAHIVTVSHDDPAYNNVAAVKPMRESVFPIQGPGEYEVSGILITGVRTFRDNEKGKLKGFNTAYVIHIDDVVFCHLGALAHELSQSQVEALGSVDVLFVPIGDDDTLSVSAAQNVIHQIQPRMVIPMLYGNAQPDSEGSLLNKFIHEFGLKDIEPQEKVSVTTANLPGEEEQARFVIMQISA
jgi:L-ascorbate metabolism protein UlaG (beta-lactamase superfamily)